jgi:uncharacterized membrane protein
VSLIVYAWLLLAGGALLDRRRVIGHVQQSIVVLAVASVKWLVIDTFMQRLSGSWGSTPYLPVLNAMMVTGLLLAGSIVAIAFLAPPLGANSRNALDEDRKLNRRLRALAGGVALFIILWAGSFEIDRFFAASAASGAMALRDARVAGQVALSVFWSIFAVGSVVAGFRFRIAALRYAGLGLFGLTLMKVMLVDLADATTGYRILSCLAVGLLMVGTSVLYGKFTPRLLQASAARDTSELPE